MHGLGLSRGDDIRHFLGRCHSLGLADVSGDVFHVLHEAVETRAAERNLPAAAVEDTLRQRALERQHREHALLDGAF